jgi:methyl-accepting chemotaxis protein
MQKKFGACFLVVSLLYLLVGIAVPKLELNPLSSITLTASVYLVIGLGAAWWISRLLSRRMRELAAAAAVIRTGDLTRRVDTAGNDEIAEVARSFAVMTDSLMKVVIEVQSTAEQVYGSTVALSGASQEMNATTVGIATAAQEIARGAEEQASRVSRTTEITGELGEIVNGVAESARGVHQAASEAAVRASAGAEEARRAAEGIGELSQRNEAATEAVDGFRHRANEIASLINSITSISHQTHVLAINAAIEAARAGEEGHGFAVVAEEVGRLADNVRGFAEQISTISEEIIDGSRRVADEIRHSVGASEALRERVEGTLTSFEGILPSIRGTGERAADIFGLTEKQRGAAEQVTESLRRISNIAERNVRGTEDACSATREQTLAMEAMARSARDLAQTSDQLKDLVAVFRLR